LRGLLELTKFRIAAASAFTATAGYVAAARAFHRGLLTALVGTLLLAMAACALNEVQEWRLDARMDRTRERPLPRGEVSTPRALALVALLAGGGALTLLLAHGPRCALLGLGAMAWYNLVYTPLKRVSAFAAVPGALLGALPPAVGWTAAGGNLGDPGLLAICGVLFLWQVPHFWLLLSLHAESYAQGGLPSLLQVFGPRRLARLTFTWTCGTLASFALLPLFHVVTSLPTLLIVGAAALWLLVRFTDLLREKAPPLRRVFMDLNAFALAVVAALVMDPFF
jgi:heme o synthase